MSSEYSKQLKDLYSEIGFIFGGTTTFQNRLLIAFGDANTCSIDDVERLVCEEINEGNFIKLFKQYSHNKGPEKAFDYFKELYSEVFLAHTID